MNVWCCTWTPGCVWRSTGAFPSPSIMVPARSALCSTTDLEVAEPRGSPKRAADPEDIKPLSLCLTPSTFFQPVLKILLWFFSTKGERREPSMFRTFGTSLEFHPSVIGPQTVILNLFLSQSFSAICSSGTASSIYSQ